jgi:hypothetical protein
MTSKKSQAKSKTNTCARILPEKDRVGSDKDIRAELSKVPIDVVAGIAASLYQHDQYPAISLLKAYELLEGAIIARNGLLAGKNAIDAVFQYDVVWDDEKRIHHFNTANAPKSEIPEVSISWINPDGRITYPLDEALISFMPNHTMADRRKKFEWFIEELEDLLDSENRLRAHFLKTIPDWDGKWAGLPPEAEGYEDGMISIPSRQIAEWGNNGIPAVIYEISRQRIRKWLQDEKSRKNSEASKSRWDKPDPDSPEDEGDQPAPLPPKSGRGKVKSKKDKRLGPRLPEWGKKLKKIVKGT